MKPFSTLRRRLILGTPFAAAWPWTGLLAKPKQVESSADNFTKYVNPFVGTDGTGHTFPGAAVPFGMVAPSPDNADRGWDYTSGYQYQNQNILGFSNTHISGAGIPELGDVLLMPRQGEAWHKNTKIFGTRKSKQSEFAAPGYYSVQLPKHQVELLSRSAVRNRCN